MKDNKVKHRGGKGRIDIVADLVKNDEYYTPAIVIKPILKYIPKGKTVWCPFDLEKSEYVKLLKEHGCKVIRGHIIEGKDFFEYEPKKYDYIISNPPYSLKNEVFTRLFKLGKPFAMFMGFQMMNYGGMMQLWDRYNYQPEMITFDRRPTFDGGGSTFMSGHFMKDIMPKGKWFEVANFNKKEFEISEMYKDKMTVDEWNELQDNNQIGLEI